MINVINPNDPPENPSEFENSPAKEAIQDYCNHNNCYIKSIYHYLHEGVFGKGRGTANCTFLTYGKKEFLVARFMYNKIKKTSVKI